VLSTNQKKMKKIYLLLGSIGLFLGSAQAQSIMPNRNAYGKISAAEVAAMKARSGGFENTGRATYDLYMDHSAANFDDDFFLWRYNSLYTTPDTALNYVGWFINKVGGYTDPADPINSFVDGATFGFTVDYPSNISMRVDSIFASISHENNSGLYDKLKMRIVQVSGAAPSLASPILWEQVDSANVSLSSGGNWVGTGAGYLLSYTPNFTVPAGTKAAFHFIYEDGSKLDTLGIAAGYVKDPLSPDPNDPWAKQSDYKTSYMRYPPFIPNITTNSNVGYGSPVGSQGWFYAQNWAIWAKVLLTEVIGFNENSGTSGFTLLHSYPNPSSILTNVSFEVPVNCNATLTVTDLSGRIVSQQEMNDLQSGRHTVSLQTENLANGIYNYTLNANGWSATKPLVVNH
jgi:hypothetical protein